MKAMICGVGGQDGPYLARVLLEKGYEVVGTSRDANARSFRNLSQLGIRERVQVTSMALDDFHSVLVTVNRYRPDEVYNLAGQSSVGLSFEQPMETIESTVIGTLNLLEAIRQVERPIRYYNASSGESFGDTGDMPATEATPFRPRSPYGVAKASAHGLVMNYREAYGLFACSGILFNHESPLRPRHFVTQKIVSAAARIASGSKEILPLGNMDIHRDWGWAPEYVEAMSLMLQQDKPDDFVIGTGKTVSLAYFVERAFDHFRLDWHDHVTVDPALRRPSDISIGRADPAKAHAKLGWRARTSVDSVVDLMCEAQNHRPN